MPKDNENVSLPIVAPDELTAPTNFQPFALDQMVRCEECLRTNPPTRVNCLYCTAVLPVNETTANLQKPALRPLEKWEQGYNNILLPLSANPGDAELDEAADVLKLAKADLVHIVSSGMPLPLARAATLDEALLVESRLGRLGIDTRIMADANLGVTEAGPIRVRAMDIHDAGISAYQTPDSPAIELLWSDFVLFVSGRLVVKRIELKEQKRARAENRILDSREFFSDESVVDLYIRNQPTPYRITANSFDFSCLGRRKSLLAGENISTLLQLLRDRAAQVEWDNSYNSMRKALEAVWPSEQQNESGGWRRDRPGKYSIESVNEISNERQFLKYSRLRYHLQCEASPGTDEDS